MIPVWLLTILHYVSLASAMVILLLLAWSPFQSLIGETRTLNTRATREYQTQESDQ